METLTLEQKEAFEQKKAAEVLTKVRAVIKHLGLTITEERERSKWRVHENATNGELSLWFSSAKSSKWMIKIGASYPRDAKGQYVDPYNYGEKRDDRINVSSSKTPEQISADINRRLMPVYLARLAKVNERIAEANAYADKTKSNLNALADIRGTKADKYEDERNTLSLTFGHSDGYGDARVQGDSVTFELRSVSIETAKKIMQAVKGA